MFVQVRLLKGFPEPLWYSVPPALSGQQLVGAVVRVPLKDALVPAFVERSTQTKPAVSFALREIVGLEQMPDDLHYTAFITRLAAYYQVNQLYLLKRIRQFVVQKEQDISDDIALTSINTDGGPAVQLTDEQQAVVEHVVPQIKSGGYAPTVIHGVTGSGKTEIYKVLISEAIAQGKSVLLLLPEVTLAVQFFQILARQLDSAIRIYSFHSATSVKEKRALWQAVLAGVPVLVIGVHLPVLLPMSNLGLCIIDEEHEIGFQEKKHPRINSKEAALLRAFIYKFPIVLGSATPSLASLHNVKKHGWQLFQIKRRFAGAFPAVRVVHLREKNKRAHFWISAELEKAIAQRLAVGQQSIIFLNRRGFSFFVQCQLCAYVFSCANCSVSLTLHHEADLLCHYCGAQKKVPPTCPGCRAPETNFLKKGIGTQQIVTVLQKMFPTARIARADLDVTVNRKKWQETVNAFSRNMLDILVGTQTVTKGYHFPGVTLVGVLWADVNLHFPMYNAAETTLQQLIQVAGRAGRQHEQSEVIIQTMLEHPIFNYLHEVDYPLYYAYEIQKRSVLGYPPEARLVEIELKHTEQNQVEADAESVAQELLRHIARRNYTIQVLGPAQPPVYRIKNIHLSRIYLKGDSMQQMAAVFSALKRTMYASSIFFTPNPLN